MESVLLHLYWYEVDDHLLTDANNKIHQTTSLGLSSVCSNFARPFTTLAPSFPKESPGKKSAHPYEGHYHHFCKL